MPGRVRSRRHFEQLARPSSRGRSGPIRIHYVASNELGEGCSVAYAISTSVGNAVERNQIRRRLRRIMDESRPPGPTGIYLIKCDIGTKDLTYVELQQHVEGALRRGNLL